MWFPSGAFSTPGCLLWVADMIRAKFEGSSRAVAACELPGWAMSLYELYYLDLLLLLLPMETERCNPAQLQET